MKKELPSGWREFQIKDICSINYGKGLGKNNIVEGNIPVYSSGGIIGYHNESLINSKGVIIGRKGNAGSVFYSNSPFFCIDTAFYVEPNDNIDLKFLYYKLISIKLERHKIDSAVPGINRDTIYSISITVPPIDEQKRIADILSTFDDLIENLKKLIEKKEIYKKGVMQRVLSGKVRFEGFTDEWEFKSLEELCNIKKGEQKNKLDLIENGEYPVLSGGMDFSGYYDSYNREANTITISEGGNSCGYVNFIKTKFWASGHCYTLHDVNIDVAFLYQCLKYNENKIMKLRLGSGLPNIQLSYIREYTLKIPPSIEEQKKIAELLSLIDQDIDSLKQILHLRRLQKKGVMQKLLTGEVRV